MKVKIALNGLGGELDSTVINIQERTGRDVLKDCYVADKIQSHLIALVSNNIILPGDTIEITEIM
jgi:hypothetical protein